MAWGICSISSCPKPTYCKGWCRRHYDRNLRLGDPLGPASFRYDDPEEAFLARSEPLLWSGCVVWTGHLDREGYGQVVVDGKPVGAHRYAWEREHGPIPEGLVVDHQLCHERSCVNVGHLRVCTQAQNTYNRKGANKTNRSSGHRNVYRTHDGKWAVQMQRDGKLHYFGRFASIEEAVTRRDEVQPNFFAER